MKPIIWVGSSKEDLSSFPEEVKQDIGYALEEVQKGCQPLSAKPLKGFGGSGVVELVDRFDGNTYRAVYAVKFRDAVYVLHCFQKKSKSGIKTPTQEMDLIKRRLKAAEEDYRARY